MEVRFIQQEDIDRLKWDSCIHYANNGNVFGYKWFLNNITKDWDALIEGDYESVFPLTWQTDALNRSVLRQPPLIRELGIYSINGLAPKRISTFLDAIPEKYKSIQVALNERITIESNKNYAWNSQSNYQLLLTESHDKLRSKYSESARTMLDAQENQLLPVSNIKPEKVADLYRQYHEDRKHIDDRFHAVQRIMYNAMHRGIGFTTGITDLKGELLAANFFIYSHNKMLSFLPIESPKGKEVGALLMLLDYILKSHAGRSLILDFNTNKNYAADLGAQENIYYMVEKEGRILKF